MEYLRPRKFRSGHFPPRAGKKGNGACRRGRRRNGAKVVTRYPRGWPTQLPHDLVYRMPPPPPRHRYVRVGSDILLLSIGSGIVVDAMIDIGR